MANDNDDKVRTSATTKVVATVGGLAAGAATGYLATGTIATFRLAKDPKLKAAVDDAIAEAGKLKDATVRSRMEAGEKVIENLAKEKLGGWKKNFAYLGESGGRVKAIALAAGATIAVGAIIYGIGHHHAKKKFAERELERRSEATAKKPDGPAM